MKKQLRIGFVGMLAAAVLLGGCGSEETKETKDTAKQEASGTEAGQETAGQTETQAETEGSEAEKASLDEPYVLVRETDTKSDIVTEYVYDENGDKVSKTVKKPNETLLWEYTTEHREDGSKQVTQAQGVLVETGEVFSPDIDEYEYSSEGLLLRETVFTDGEMLMEILYEYDENGRLIRQNGTGRDMTKTYEYDENGNLVKQTNLDTRGEVEGWFTFEYDEDGKQILKHKFTATGEESDLYELCQWQYEYDEDGRIIEEWKEGTEQGGKYEHYQYEYDEYGNVCKKKDLTLHMTYEYLPLSVHLTGN